MISAQSHRSRRVLGRLDRGSNLIHGIIELCTNSQVRSGEFRASGWLEDVELQEYEPQHRRLRPRSLSAPVHLVSLQGTIAEQDATLSVSAHAMVARSTDNGIQVLGGLIASARVVHVEVIIDAFDDVLLRRGVDPQTGLPGWSEILAEASPDMPIPMAVKEARLLALKEAHLKGGTIPTGQFDDPVKAPAVAPVVPIAAVAPPRAPEPAPQQAVRAPQRPEPKPEPKIEPKPETRPEPGIEPRTEAPAAAAQAPGWEAVKAVSEAQTEAESAEVVPQRGDLVEHTTFGRCTIEKVEEAQERVSVRVRSGRLVQLSLEYLSLEPIGREGRARIFKAVKRR